MKRILTLLLAIVPYLVPAQSGTQPLTNVDVIKLSKLDLPTSAIIGKIRNSPTHFNVDVDALVDLKSMGVSGEVITEMISIAASVDREAASHGDLRDPATFRKQGIYYYNKHDSTNLFVPIDPTVVSSSRSGGVGAAIAQRYSYGIAESNRVSSLSGAHSMREIVHAMPRFYFYLDPRSSLSPNEFSLVRLTVRRHERTMIVGSSNAYGQSIGIPGREKVDFSYTQVADGIYKVYPKEPLEDGEYCFVYTGSAPTMFSGSEVYDFSIAAGQ